MKKEYMKPTLDVVRIQPQSIICTSPLTIINAGDTGIVIGGPGDGDARVRELLDGIDFDNRE